MNDNDDKAMAETGNGEGAASTFGSALPQFMLASSLAHLFGPPDETTKAVTPNSDNQNSVGYHPNYAAHHSSASLSNDSTSTSSSAYMCNAADAPTEKKTNVTLALNPNTALLFQNGVTSSRDNSTTSSEVHPRIIPFGGSTNDQPNDSSAEASTQSFQTQTNSNTTKFKNEEKGSAKYYNRLLSDAGSESEDGPASATIEGVDNGTIPNNGPKDAATKLIPTKQRISATTTDIEQQAIFKVAKEVPSVLEDLDTKHGLDMSALSWVDEPFKVGDNAYIGKQVGTDDLIMYRVLSKEEAEGIIENKGTFDTESPLLSCTSAGGKSDAASEINSGNRAPKRSSYGTRCKLRIVLGFAGCMILLIGLFVGVAATLFNIDKAGSDTNVTTSSGDNSVEYDSSWFSTDAPTQELQQIESLQYPTAAPSAMDASETLSPTVKFVFPEYTWNAINDSNSSQAKAFEFLQTDPPMMQSSTFQRLQRFALATLFHSTEGDKWARKDSWLRHDVHECDWQGITCENKVIERIVLPYNHLDGVIEPELELLTSLLILDLSGNKLHGSIPEQFMQLTSLLTLNLTSNHLTSTIPSGLYQVSTLQELNLGENSLSGSLSSEIGFLTNLREVRMHMNKLVGSIPPQIEKLTNATVFSFFDNTMTGNLPIEFRSLTKLQKIELDNNRFNMSIPSELGLLTDLQSLWLSTCSFTGWAPTELGLLTNLQELFFQVNKISGLIPTELGKLTRLRTLKLFENDLRSRVPSELGNLAQLEELSLGWNSLSGFIFSEVGRLENLVELDLVSNSLDGTIPASIANLTNLKHLWLFSNNLEGQIPSNLGQLSQLDQMLLFFNWLTGP